MKKQCNPLKIMFKDLYEFFVNEVTIGLTATLTLIYLQLVLLFGAFNDYTFIKVLDRSGDHTFHYERIPTNLALWCRGVLFLEVALFVCLLIWVWWASASERCK